MAMTRTILIAAAAWLLMLQPVAGADPDAIFIIRTTDKPPAAAVDAIEAYVREHKWIYLGANKVKMGQVTLVKVCIPEVGNLVWPLGLQLSALLPCGNLGVYEKDGVTEISTLHPRYMSILYPDPALEQAGAVAAPLLSAMLDAVAP
jgi:hypothetical protein